MRVTEEAAKAAVEVLVQYLKERVLHPSSESTARTWAWALLDAAEADGHGGCQLCHN